MSQTLERALTILNYVAEDPRHIGEVANFLGVHHSTALRLLHTLRRHGFVAELPDHRYRLGAATFRLAYQALEALDLRETAQPSMERLNKKTGETIHLGTLEGDNVVYINKVEAQHPVRMHSRVGAIANLHCAGVSKAILAFLPEEKRRELLADRPLTRRTEHTLTTLKALEADLAVGRQRGYVLDDEENEVGIHCIAAPVFDGSGAVAGSISISTPMSRIDRATLTGFVPALLETTREISEELGWRNQ
jgi:IclR family transcriptional regulator, KDG regulon repressor